MSFAGEFESDPEFSGLGWVSGQRLSRLNADISTALRGVLFAFPAMPVFGAWVWHCVWAVSGLANSPSLSPTAWPHPERSAKLADKARI